MQSIGWLIKSIFTMVYTIAVTRFVWKWAVWCAYAERGYKAVGSEYFLVGIAGVAALELSMWLFEILEEWNYAKNQKRSGNAPWI